MPAKANATGSASNPLAHYVAVRVNTLRTIGGASADLFVQYEPNSVPILYCRAGHMPDAQQFLELEAVGVENLYVRAADFANFSDGLLDSLETVMRQDSLPATEKFAAMQLAVAVTVDHALRLVDCAKFCELADKVGKDVVALLVEGEVLPRELFQIARHDFNTFTHVTNVASYCVMLARQMGVADADELRKIASAAVLHDLGKRFISASILTKAGRLTIEERAIVEAHPQRGYEELCHQSDLEHGQLMMVYQHHERVDGTGYPVRVPMREIHPWARMLSVVDVFDSMTARRPYRRAATPETVLDYQRQQAGKHFDHEVVECWASAMTKA